MILQLNPEIPIHTPKGKAWAFAIIDRGIDADLEWLCFIEETGESWTFLNKHIKALDNQTYGRKPISTPPSYFQYEYTSDPDILEKGKDYSSKWIWSPNPDYIPLKAKRKYIKKK